MKVNYFGVLNFVHHWMKNDGNRAAIEPVHFIVTSSVNVLWAPPGGSAYRASKAAISKAFEGLSASLYKRAQFSSIYCGPGLTKGLKGSLPLRWPTTKMAKYLADFAEGKKKENIPRYFIILCVIY